MIKSNTKKSAVKSNVSTKSAKKVVKKSVKQKAPILAPEKTTAFAPNKELVPDLEGITPVLNDYQKTALVRVLEAVKGAKGEYCIIQKDENSTPWLWIKCSKENKEIIKSAGVRKFNGKRGLWSVVLWKAPKK